MRIGTLAAALTLVCALTAPVQSSAEERPPLIWFTLIVTLPPSTPIDDAIYLALDHDGWRPDNPALRLRPHPNGRYELSLQAPAGLLLHFLFCRGNWDTVELRPDGTPLEGRALRPAEGHSYELRVARWKDTDTSTVHGQVEEFVDPAFLHGRRCWVYLPPEYAKSDQRYPVLYMLDGQNLFDRERSYVGEWEVDESLERMIPAGEIPAIIVVGIENAGTARMDEYTPWPDPQWHSGGGGRRFLLAVADTLKPAIDGHYRTLPGAENTYLAGSSLGGLIAAWAAWTFGDVFRGGIGAGSPSYWWNRDHILHFAQSHGRPQVRRFYQDMGTLESSDPADSNRTSDAVTTLIAMQSILERTGMQEGKDFLSLQAQGHRHSESFWARRFPVMVRFLLRSGPARTKRKRATFR